MEEFNSTYLRNKPYRAVFVQQGGSMEMDRYIYGMQGEGIGSFLGSLLKKALPLASQAIKATAKTAKPIAVAAGKELLATGAKRASKRLKRLANTEVTHKHHPKRRRKWRNL